MWGRLRATESDLCDHMIGLQLGVLTVNPFSLHDALGVGGGGCGRATHHCGHSNHLLSLLVRVLTSLHCSHVICVPYRDGEQANEL